MGLADNGLEEYQGDAFPIDPPIAVGHAQAPYKKPFVAVELEAKAQLFAERNKLYGDNYKRFGSIMALMLAGQKLDCNDPKAMNRLGVFVQVVSKLTRYGENFSRGGHDDSLDDIAVYSMMLKELDHE